MYKQKVDRLIIGNRKREKAQHDDLFVPEAERLKPGSYWDAVESIQNGPSRSGLVDWTKMDSACST